MIAPGSLDFGIIRGIAFDEVILQCRDDKVSVTATSTPDVTGLFIPCGLFSGKDLFILAGVKSYFIYFNQSLLTYVISETLSTANPVNYFAPSSPLTEPTGIYSAVGTYIGSADASDNPTDLTGFSAEGIVRRTEKIGAEVILDFQPQVSNPSIGEVTIPAISTSDTESLAVLGTYFWDLVFKNIATGERFAPPVRGKVVISDNITSPLAV